MIPSTDCVVLGIASQVWEMYVGGIPGIGSEVAQVDLGALVVEVGVLH